MHSKAAIIERALLKQKTGRMPCFPLIDIAFASSYAGQPMREVQFDPQRHAYALSKCAEQLPVDGIYINLCLDARQGKRVSESEVLIDDSLLLVIPENDVLSISSTEIKSLDDDRILEAELFHPGMLATYQNIDDPIKDEYAVVVGITGTFSQVAFLFGITEIMMALLDQPELLQQTLKKRHEVAVRQVQEICAAGARFIWIGEGLGSGSLISPDQYRDFVLPYEIELAEEIRKHGALSLLHICGNVTNTLADIAKSAADGFDLDYPVDLVSALDTLLPDVAVKGNVNPQLFMEGCSEELENACQEAKAAAADREGFIMSTGCLVPRDSVPESFRIMADICEYGRVEQYS
jgi:uroporphyrinogen-III decarboxylase